MLKNKLIFIFIFNAFQLFSQDGYIDSLLLTLNKSPEDTNKVKTLLKITEYQNYTLSNFEQAIVYGQLANNLATKLKYKIGEALSCKNLAYAYDWNAYNKTGDYSNVVPFYTKALKLYTELMYTSEIANIDFLIGYSLDYQADYSSAIKYYYKSLKLYEQLNDTLHIMRLYFVIGQSHNFQSQTTKALEYLFKANHLAILLNNKEQHAECLTVIANTYAAENKTDTAIAYLNKALVITQAIPKLKNELGEIYCNISEVYIKKKDFQSALTFAQQALLYDDITGDTYAKAKLNSIIGRCYQNLKKYKNAIHFYEKAIEYSQISGSKNITTDQYKYLSEVYEKIGETNKAFNYYKKYVALYDSTFNANKAKEIMHEEMQYLFNKQEIEQKMELAKKDALVESTIARQKNIKTLLIVSMLAMAIILSMVVIRYLEKKKQNNIIQSQKDEITIQNTEIIKQKKAIEEKNKKINESIVNAQNLQNVIFPPTSVLNKIIPNHFVIHLPKDIVSGDFYWAYENEQYKYIALIDCTGHGVSGALMSMLAYNLLNDAVIYRGEYMPSKILDVLNQQVLSSLTRNTQVNDSIEGGMDISICCIDKKNSKLYASSAHQPIYIVNAENVEVIPGDIHSIGWLFDNIGNNYSQVEIPLSDTTFIYLSSDGFKDQFGGHQRKKYSAARFEKLLTKLALTPIANQQKQIIAEFEQWKQKNEQLDDICIIGFKAL